MIRPRLLIVVLSFLFQIDVDFPSADEIVEAFMSAFENRIGNLFEEGIKWTVGMIKGGIEALVGPALDIMLYVPAPRPVGVYFKAPSNAPWGELYSYIISGTLPLGFGLLLLAWQLGQAGSSVGVLDAGKTRKLDRGLFAGIFILPLSYVICAIFLQFVNILTFAIAPTPTEVADLLMGLFSIDQIVGSAGLVVTGYLLSSIILVLLLVSVGVNVLRIVGLLLLTVLMPVLISFKLAGLPYFEGWADRFINMYVSLGLSSILIAVGFRLTFVLIDDGGVKLAGIPGSNLITPFFAMLPFIFGVAIPAVSVSSSMHLTEIAGAVSGSGIAGKAASTATSDVSSKAGAVAQKTGAKGALSKGKQEYSSLREWGVDDRGDELADEVDVDSSPPGGPSGGVGARNTGRQEPLPVPLESDVPDDGYSAGSGAEYVGPTFGDGANERVSEEAFTEEDNQIQGDEVDGSKDDGNSESTSGTNSDSTSSAASSEAAGTGSADHSDTTENDRSSTHTTVERLASDPGNIPDGKDLSLDAVEYREHNGEVRLGDQSDTEANVGGYLEDRHGNRVPVTDWEEAPLDDGQTYDLAGAETQQHFLSEDAETHPNSVTNGSVDIDPDENGRFVSVSVDNSTAVEESAQTYREDFSSRLKSNLHGAPGQVAKGGVSRARNAPGNLKQSAVSSLDDALLTEEARETLGKLPSEVREGARVHADQGNRVVPGEVKDTWTDEQADREMASVQFDGDSSASAVPVENLSLSMSRRDGKITPQEDEP